MDITKNFSQFSAKKIIQYGRNLAENHNMRQNMANSNISHIFRSDGSIVKNSARKSK